MGLGKGKVMSSSSSSMMWTMGAGFMMYSDSNSRMSRFFEDTGFPTVQVGYYWSLMSWANDVLPTCGTLGAFVYYGGIKLSLLTSSSTCCVFCGFVTPRIRTPLNLILSVSLLIRVGYCVCYLLVWSTIPAYSGATGMFAPKGFISEDTKPLGCWGLAIAVFCIC